MTALVSSSDLKGLSFDRNYNYNNNEASLSMARSDFPLEMSYPRCVSKGSVSRSRSKNYYSSLNGEVSSNECGSAALTPLGSPIPQYCCQALTFPTDENLHANGNNVDKYYHYKPLRKRRSTLGSSSHASCFGTINREERPEYRTHTIDSALRAARQHDYIPSSSIFSMGNSSNVFNSSLLKSNKINFNNDNNHALLQHQKNQSNRLIEGQYNSKCTNDLSTSAAFSSNLVIDKESNILCHQKKRSLSRSTRAIQSRSVTPSRNFHSMSPGRRKALEKKDDAIKKLAFYDDSFVENFVLSLKNEKEKEEKEIRKKNIEKEKELKSKQISSLLDKEKCQINKDNFDDYEDRNDNNFDYSNNIINYNKNFNSSRHKSKILALHSDDSDSEGILSSSSFSKKTEKKNRPNNNGLKNFESTYVKSNEIKKNSFKISDENSQPLSLTFLPDQRGKEQEYLSKQTKNLKAFLRKPTSVPMVNDVEDSKNSIVCNNNDDYNSSNHKSKQHQYVNNNENGNKLVFGDFLYNLSKKNTKRRREFNSSSSDDNDVRSNSLPLDYDGKDNDNYGNNNDGDNNDFSEGILVNNSATTITSMTSSALNSKRKQQTDKKNRRRSRAETSVNFIGVSPINIISDKRTTDLPKDDKNLLNNNKSYIRGRGRSGSFAVILRRDEHQNNKTNNNSSFSDLNNVTVDYDKGDNNNDNNAVLFPGEDISNDFSNFLNQPFEKSYVLPRVKNNNSILCNNSKFNINRIKGAQLFEKQRQRSASIINHLLSSSSNKSISDLINNNCGTIANNKNQGKKNLSRAKSACTNKSLKNSLFDPFKTLSGNFVTTIPRKEDTGVFDPFFDAAFPSPNKLSLLVNNNISFFPSVPLKSKGRK